MHNPRQSYPIPPSDEIKSVSEFTSQVKYLLETMIGGVWIRGEISNFRRQQSGHVYFSLRDAGSQVSAVLFRNDALKQTIPLKDGLQVIAFGQVNVYEPRGNYQLIIRMVAPDGFGMLQQEFERLKAKLQKQGLFDAERKRPIPLFPRAIGIVTSPTGAAVQDFIRILKRREWVGRILILPAKVQGSGSAKEIVRMIELAQTLPGMDLLVVGRGGGSMEDLWCFNDEKVVLALADSRIPVISAVGHEVDFTLSDFVADLRAETPSAAAEIVSTHYREVRDRFQRAGQNLARWVWQGLHSRGEYLHGLRRRLQVVEPLDKIEQGHLRLDDLEIRLNGVVNSRILQGRHRLSEVSRELQKTDPMPLIHRARLTAQTMAHRLHNALAAELLRKKSNLQRARSLLGSLSPRSVLNRGFAIIRDGMRRPIVSKQSILPGDAVWAEFKDGEVRLTREKKRGKRKEERGKSEKK